MSNLRRGFTLIELMVVMAIIAILSVLIVGAISAARKQADQTQRIGNVKSLETALEAYAAKHQGSYPARPADGSGPIGCSGMISTPSFCSNGLILPKVLKEEGFLTSDLLGLDTLTRFNVDRTGGKYTLFACSSNTTSILAIDYTKAGIPEPVGQEGNCTGGTVLFSVSR